MSSIVLAVLKATLGLLLDKVRDAAAENLRDGDVTDQKFRGLIVREINDITRKLDGIARKDLFASISFFKEGIEFLYEVLEKARSGSGEVTAAASGTAHIDTFYLGEGMRKLELTGLDASSTRALANAKKRFEDARREATKAFANEALELSDRVLAMQYRVMATILETVDNPKDAVPACRVCNEDLRGLLAVQRCFNIELNKGFRAWFSREERRKIISIVCRVNRAIYDVMQAVDDDVNLWNWPCVHFEEEKVDPLRDSRVAKILSKLDMDDCCVTPWSFGQEGEVDQKLKKARGIVTNTQGQFILGDNSEDCNRNVKVFNNKGKFLRSFCLPSDDERTSLSIYDVATDVNDNIYVLVRLMKPGANNHLYISVYVYDHTADLRHRFNVSDDSWDLFWFALAVNDNNKVMVVANKVVDVYETGGQFVRTLGQGILNDVKAITAANEGRVMVVDRRINSYVHMFSEQGEHLLKFRVQGYYFLHKIAFHRNSKHVIVTGTKERLNGTMCILICTKDGEFLRSITLGITEKLTAITVTKEGRFAVVCDDMMYPSKVLVV